MRWSEVLPRIVLALSMALPFPALAGDVEPVNLQDGRTGLQTPCAGSILQSVPCRPVDGKIFPLADGHKNDDDALVVNLVD